MIRIKEFVVIVSLTLILGSCKVNYYDSNYFNHKSAYNGSKELANMNKLIGLTKPDLITAFGAPNRIVDDGSGRDIVVFERNSSFSYNGTGGSSTFFREFFLDSSGRVTRFRFGYRQ